MPEPVLTCPICEEPIRPGEPWQQDLEGGGAHHRCLETVEQEEEQHGER